MICIFVKNLILYLLAVQIQKIRKTTNGCQMDQMEIRHHFYALSKFRYIYEALYRLYFKKKYLAN
jgi:hypothetical protein